MSFKPSPLLLLHATAGAGHTRAAQAIAAALDRNDSAPAEGHQVIDTLACTTAFFRHMYVRTYIQLVQRAPELWGYLYERYDRTPSAASKSARIRLAFDKLNSRSFKKMLLQTQAKTIVCTHFLPLELLSDLKARGQINAAVHAVITDVSPHAFWIYPHIDHYHVASLVSARELERKGVAPERISVTGIPIDPVFAEPCVHPAIMRAQLSLPERPTVLLLSGGFGVGPLLAMLDSFSGPDCGLSLIVVAGRNAQLEQACKERAAKRFVPISVHGFVNNIHELMDAADLVVTKPGGLSTNEILAKGKPMVLIAPIPGQEQRNCDYLLEEGAAVRLHDVRDAAWHFQRWLGNSALMAKMHLNAQRIAQPHSASLVAQHLVRGLLQHDSSIT
jgi:processive 1,2-diacylglycerol beta-glucosyltransferase